MVHLICSVCKSEHNRQGQRHCLPCKNAYMREWRKTNKLQGEALIKARARCIAQINKRRGLIQKEPCGKCGAEDSQMHHPDYSQPRLVKWLCRPCHMAEHANDDQKLSETA